MNMRSKIVCSASILLCTVVFAAVVPVLQAKHSDVLTPFVGMAELWYNNDNGKVYSGEVNVIQYDTTAGTVLINDALWGYMKASVTTRAILWGTGIYNPGDANPLWIPTNVKVGDNVKVSSFEATVTGDTEASVQGREVSCWQVQHVWTDNTGYHERTYLYEKKTGLCVATAMTDFDPSTGDPVWHFASFVMSTNYPL
jgi:hypothetical protein